MSGVFSCSSDCVICWGKCHANCRQNVLTVQLLSFTACNEQQSCVLPQGGIIEVMDTASLLGFHDEDVCVGVVEMAFTRPAALVV